MESFFKQKNLWSQIDVCSKNAVALWNSKYKNYVRNFMNQIYIPFIEIKNKH